MNLRSRSARLTIQLVLTFSFFLVELIVGILVNSLALISDAFHMLSDVLALAVAVYAIRVAKRDTSKSMSFGWARAEVVGAFANAIFLIALCFTLIIDAIERLASPEEVSNSFLLLVVGAAGLFINIIGLIFFHEAAGGHSGHSHGHSHGHAHGHKKKGAEAEPAPSGTIDVESNINNNLKNKNFNMRGVFLHVLGDALGSIAVIIVGVVLYTVPDLEFIVYLDPILSLFITALLLGGSIPLAKQTANVLLHRVPQTVDVDEVSVELKKVEGIIYVHEFHVWQMSDTMLVGSCHVICSPNADQMALIAKIKAILHAHDVHETTIQLEPLSDGAEEEQCLLECEKDCHTKTCHPRKSDKKKKAAAVNE